jgi:hypothetical protein
MLLVEVMVPENEPLMDTEIGELLPAGSGTLSVTCSVRVWGVVVKLIFELAFAPVNFMLPKFGLPLVVISVEGAPV